MSLARRCEPERRQGRHIDAAKFIAAANKAGAIPSQSIGAFAGQAAIFPNVDTLQKLNPMTLDDTKTDIAQALGFADATFPSGYNKTIVLFTMGR